MKVTDKQIALEFGLTVQTLTNWKKGSKETVKRYHALKHAIIDKNMLIWEVSTVDGEKDYINNSVIGAYTIENNHIIKSMRLYN